MPYRDRPLTQDVCTNCRAAPPREGFKRCQRCYDHYKDWQLRNPESGQRAKARFKERYPHSERDRKRKLRETVLSAYGGICVCCGETETIFLAVDHVDGVKLEPYPVRQRGDALYSWLKRENYPEGYRILCNNCNWAVRFGPCPHTLKDRRVEITC